MTHLELQPLTAETFAPFGQVIDSNAACERYPINEGLTQRHHALAEVDCSAGDGRAVLSLFRAQAIGADFVLRFMERHPLGSQAFINVSGNPYAIVVAPAGPLNEEALRAFLAGPHQSISYHRGTWHHYLLALAGPSDFVVVDRDGPGNNCDEQALHTPVRLVQPR